MGLRVTLAGRDITPFVQEETIQIKDVLGQGTGPGASSAGRAATAQLLTTLGPAASASGAGQLPSGPVLARMGELVVYDATTTAIFGGFVGQLEDKTVRTTRYTQLDAYDYWQQLDRIQVQQVYTGQSDVFIIRNLLKTYAPWVRLDRLPTLGTYTFSIRVLKATSLQKALAAITDTTGYNIWIDNAKYIHYETPANAQAAPFSLSNTPDFRRSFNVGVDTYVVDDTSAINRVTFFGGKKPSNDFTQDLSTQVNGTNTTFVLAYYPRNASDGKIHITLNGRDQTLGYLLGSGVANTFISKGGTAQVLLNADAHTVQFDVAPPAGSIVTARYRYEFPMNIQVADPASFRYYGMWLDGVISDESIFDAPTAVGRCRTLLAQQSHGLVTCTCHCFKPGLRSGQIVSLSHSIRGITGKFMVQEVDTVPLGAGTFQYNLTLGAWRLSLVDVVMSTIAAAHAAGINLASDAQDNGDITNAIQVQQMLEAVKMQEGWTMKTHATAQFYARATPLGDGHDAYCGLATI